MLAGASVAIEVEGLVKRFGAIEALKGLSFQVPRERVFCILGPNGAGKTTLIRILTTVTRPGGGWAKLEGFNVVTQPLAVRQLIGVVAQDNHFDRYLSIWHNLILHAQMHGLFGKVGDARVTELLKQVGMYERRNALPDDLSGGMQRRICLIRALIHQPKILFLDEPSTGLDPQARLEIWETIEQFKRTATVILTTHYMEEADRLGDGILMVNHGQVVMEGTPHDLKQSISPLDNYELVLRQPLAQSYLDRLMPLITQIGGQMNQLDDFRLAFQLGQSADVHALINQVDSTDLMRFGRLEADLEDVFLSVATSPKPDVAGMTRA